MTRPRRKLSETTFTVFDIETTGFDRVYEGVTEIGAVKVLNGQVIGTLQILVDPGVGIAPQIERLTGIYSSMVDGCPPIDHALPQFLQFSQGTSLVAHNASFDSGFLAKKAELHGIAWPKFEVIDTLALARRLVDYSEVEDHKLASLATIFSPDGNPCHRALADAMATVDVMHGLFDRLVLHRVTTVERLYEWLEFTPKHRKPKPIVIEQPRDPRVNYDISLVPF